MESVAFAGNLDTELSFVAAVGFEDSGFLVAADVVGFLTPAAESGRPTSLLAAADVLGGCAAVLLPVEGTTATLEAAGLAVAVADGLAVAVVGLDVVGVGRAVEGAVVGLVALETGAPPALVGAEVLGLGAADVADLLVEAVVLGRARLAASGFFLGGPFTVDGLVPFVAVVAATLVVLVGPAGFLSAALVWLEEGVAPPNGVGGAPATFVALAVAVLLVAATETLLEDLTSFLVRCEAAPGLEMDPETPVDLALGCILLETPVGLALASAATGLPLVFGSGSAAASLVASPG